MLAQSLRLAVAERLERGASPTALGSMLARQWARRARLERPLRAAIPSLCVGGATLGGSGKTPLAIACARHLASLGHRVALVGHAYGASPPRAPRRVLADDDPKLVGDEALECARALDGVATVLVARRKQDALDEAARIADVVVLDGPLQLAPARATLSLLAVDARAPWGSGACPPLGDLRAPREALLAATDEVVSVAGSSRGVVHRGELLRWDEIAARRVGLVTGIARPGRVTELMCAHGVVPRCAVSFADHGALILRTQNAHRVELWLTTQKDHARGADFPAIDYYLDLPDSTAQRLTSRFPFRF